MFRDSKGAIIRVDRLVFDRRNKRRKNVIIQEFVLDVSPTLNKIKKEEISIESHLFIPSDQIQIIRLTLEDLNKDEKKIYSIDHQSSPITQMTIKEKDEDILSPIYESIDGRHHSIDIIQKEKLC